MPTAGSPRGGEEIDLANAVQALLNEFNGNIDSANLKDASIAAGDLQAALLDVLGVTGGAVTRRGKSIIATSEARTNVAYGLMPTPDQVSGIVLPTDGLIVVSFRAIWQNSVPGAAKAALFLGANQLVVQNNAGAPSVAGAEAVGPSTGADDDWLYSSPTGLLPAGAGGSAGAATDVATGMVVGNGAVLIEAAAGTYDVSVQFKASSGSVTAKKRKLWVWTVGF